MNDNTRDREPPGGIAKIEELIRAVEDSADPAARDHVRELARAILDLHRTGLRRMVGLIAKAGEPGAAILDACTQDGLVGSLLLLHDLHPQGPETRVQEALVQLQPLLLQHGVALEFVGVADGLVRLKVPDGNQGTPLAPALSRLVEGAILEAIPDVERIEFADASAHGSGPPSGMISLPVLGEEMGHCRGSEPAAGETSGRHRQRARPPASGI